MEEDGEDGQFGRGYVYFWFNVVKNERISVECGWSIPERNLWNVRLQADTVNKKMKFGKTFTLN